MTIVHALPEAGDLLVSEVARDLRTTPHKVYDLYRLGKLAGYRLGPQGLRITRESLDAFKASGGVGV